MPVTISSHSFEEGITTAYPEDPQDEYVNIVLVSNIHIKV